MRSWSRQEPRKELVEYSDKDRDRLLRAWSTKNRANNAMRYKLDSPENLNKDADEAAAIINEIYEKYGLEGDVTRRSAPPIGMEYV